MAAPSQNLDINYLSQLDPNVLRSICNTLSHDTLVRLVSSGKKIQEVCGNVLANKTYQLNAIYNGYAQLINSGSYVYPGADNINSVTVTRNKDVNGEPYVRVTQIQEINGFSYPPILPNMIVTQQQRRGDAAMYLTAFIDVSMRDAVSLQMIRDYIIQERMYPVNA